MLLGSLVLVDRSSARRRLRLAQSVVLGGAVESLLKDRLGVVHLELGLEAGGIGGEAAAVRAAPGFGKVEALVDDLITCVTPLQMSAGCFVGIYSAAWCGIGQSKHVPVALSAAVLLGLLGVLSGEAALGKVARQMLRCSRRAVGETGMVLVVELVRASHCGYTHISHLFVTRMEGRGHTHCWWLEWVI